MDLLVSTTMAGAAVSWLVAVLAAIRLVGTSPSGTGFATIFDLGMWRFGRIEARAGHAARVQIDRYRKAFMAFFLFVLAGMAAGVFAIQQNTAN